MIKKYKYIVKTNGYVTIKGSPTRLEIGKEVSKFIFDNYPNFVREEEIVEKEILIEQPIEPVTPIIEPIVEPEPVPVIIEELVEEINELPIEEPEMLMEELEGSFEPEELPMVEVEEIESDLIVEDEPYQEPEEEIVTIHTLDDLANITVAPKPKKKSGRKSKNN